MGAAGRGAVGHPVEGEYVEIYPSEIPEMLALDKGCLGVLYLAEREGVVGVAFRADQFEVLREPFLPVGEEPVVVGAGHTDVEVVVPGYEAAVAYRSEEGSGDYVVSEAVLAAHGVDSLQNLHQAQLQRAYFVVHGWVTCSSG